MVKGKINELKAMIGGIRVMVNRVSYDLEHITTVLDNKFTRLNSAKLPEYKEALKAIESYKEALAKYFALKYKESELKEEIRRMLGE